MKVAAEQVCMAKILANIHAQIQALDERLKRIQQQRGETGFGNAPGAEYVEPKLPDHYQAKHTRLSYSKPWNALRNNEYQVNTKAQAHHSNVSDITLTANSCCEQILSFLKSKKEKETLDAKKKETKKEEKQVISNQDLCLAENYCSNASLIHLSVSEGVGIGAGTTREGDARDVTPLAEKKQEPDQKDESTITIQQKQDKSFSQLINLVSNNPKDVVMHLLCSEELEKGLGTLERRTEPTSQAYTQGELNGEAKSEIGDFTKDATSLPKENSSKPWRGVIHSLLIKEEPPDAQHRSYPSHMRTMTRGNSLNPLMMHNTNLLPLNAGDIVSRSKPFQEREYDEDIKSSSAKDHETRSHDAERMKLRRAKETCELSSAQMEAQAKYSGSTKTWRTYSTHLEFTTKKNQPKRSPDEEDIEDTTWKTFNGPDGDRRSLNEVFQPNQEEPSNKSNCFGLSTHQVTASNWTQDQIHFGLRVIDVTNRVNRNFPDLDIGALIGASRSNQKDLSYKPTWSVILIQIGSSENWIYTKVGSDEKDIQFLSQRILDLPYLEPSEFGRLQTYLWRPGGNLNNLEASKSILSCTSIQRIRRILPHLYFPFPDKITLGAFKEFTQQLFDSGQRLYLCCCCVLEGLLIILDVPRHHTFTPKLSRLKHHHNLLYLADFLIKSPTALFSFIAAICLLILAYYHCARAPI